MPNIDRGTGCGDGWVGISKRKEKNKLTGLDVAKVRSLVGGVMKERIGSY